MLLLEPFVGQIMGCIIGQDLPPSLLTYIGGSGIVLGLFLTIKGNSLLTANVKKDASNNFMEIEMSMDSSQNLSLV